MQDFVVYNGFRFPFTTMQVIEGPLWASDGATQIGTQQTFKISGWLTAGGPEGLQALKQMAQCELMQPRKSFYVDWAKDSVSGANNSEDAKTGTRLYETYRRVGPYYDIDNGPKPGPLIFDAIVGGRAVHYTWSLTATMKNCYGPDCALKPNTESDILAITRRFTSTIDQNGLTTRQVSGELIIRGAPKDIRDYPSADAFRPFIDVATPFNFQRVSESFDQSPDGRVLTYAIVDQERIWTYPDPITDCEVTWNISIPPVISTKTSDIASLITTFTLSGYMGAPRLVSKATIINRIIGLLAAKEAAITAAAPTVLIRHAHNISESVYGNRIAFQFTILVPGGVLLGTNAVNVGLKTINVAPPLSTGTTHRVGVYGGDANGDSGIVAARFQNYDACDKPAPLAGNANNPGLIPRPGSGAKQPPVDPSSFPQLSNGISDTHGRTPFFSFRETISYEVDNGIIVFDAKKKDQAPLAQQTHMPKVTVIQAGYFTVAAKNSADVPPPPLPFFDKDKGYMLMAHVTPDNPIAIGDGEYNLYSVHWRYIMRPMAATKAFADLKAAWPIDPRRPDDQQGGMLPKQQDKALPLVQILAPTS
jgi:hypothetical protein